MEFDFILGCLFGFTLSGFAIKYKHHKTFKKASNNVYFRISEHDTMTTIETSFISFWIFKYDKIQHFIAGIIMYYASGCNVQQATLYNIAWECKDALCYYDVFGKTGGEGASWRDLSMSQLGIFATHYALLYLI